MRQHGKRIVNVDELAGRLRNPLRHFPGEFSRRTRTGEISSYSGLFTYAPALAVTMKGSTRYLRQTSWICRVACSDPK